MKRLKILSKISVIKFFFVVFFLTSCSYGDDIDSLRNRISNLENAVRNLQTAYNECKIISSVDALTEGEGGYLVSFSDGTSLTLYHGSDGNDGLTPMINIDEEGYWLVSYDNGATYIRLLDASGNPISAIGSKGDKGDSIICVRVVVTEGMYVFELYSPDAPDTVIESIPTPYSANPERVLQSVVEDQNNGVITLTMADGTSFRFNLDVSYPTSIVLLTDHINIVGNDRTATFEFRINPSNSFINFVYDGDGTNIELDQISITRAGDADSYVTTPANYKIIDVSPSLNTLGERKVGQYTVTVRADSQDVDGEDITALVITTKDGRGNKIQISSTLMTVAYDTRPQIYGINVGGIEATKTDNDTFYVKLPYGTNATSLSAEFSTNSDISVGGVSAPETIDLSNPLKLNATLNGVTREYNLIAYYSNLPVVYVNTPDHVDITSKDVWVKKSTIQIANAGNDNAIYEKVQLKGRGNTTWGQPKKPYAIKLDKGVEVLGMPAHKRWCLLANYFDPSDLKNAVALKISSILSGIEWSPSGEFVDLVLNGQMMGNYFLCEQIKVDENRVNIDELKETDTDESSISGGYLLELDTYYDEIFKFKTDFLQLPVNLKSPDENVPDEQFEYIKNYFNTVEEKLINHEAYSEIENLIDIDSFIDWWLLHELTYNFEPNHPKSSYMYKKRGGKLYAGPAWDYDFSFSSLSEWLIKDAIWYKYLFGYEEFVLNVKNRWTSHRELLSVIPNYIDIIGKEISESASYDVNLWQYNCSLNGYGTFTYDEIINKLKSYYEVRFKWIDENIPSLSANFSN